MSRVGSSFSLNSDPSPPCRFLGFPNLANCPLCFQVGTPYFKTVFSSLICKNNHLWFDDKDKVIVIRDNNFSYCKFCGKDWSNNPKCLCYSCPICEQMQAQPNNLIRLPQEKLTCSKGHTWSPEQKVTLRP